jgi:glyoxylase-like metal-dependent hydrolase (beta-lactamase superfamily II)
VTKERIAVAAGSPDSGLPWDAEGAWSVAPGIHRIPLPLPDDGLRAVNVYALEVDDGLVLVDGGWALPMATDILDRSLRSIGYGLAAITTFLVTHAHRDHYTLARVLGDRLDARVVLGAGERPALDALQAAGWSHDPLADLLRDAGADELADRVQNRPFQPPDPAGWGDPDHWLEGEETLYYGDRRVEAVPTPGHTPGHFVFVEEALSLLFAGDHVLPTMTPSVGYAMPRPVDSLGDFRRSLTRVLHLPDLQVLPAHGPTGTRSHARARQLLNHHDARLEETLGAIRHGPRGVVEVAAELPWTRRELDLAALELSHQALAVLETEVHLELLVADGRAREVRRGGRREYRVVEQLTGLSTGD